MTGEQKNQLQFEAYHLARKKMYPIVSLGVHGTIRKHTLLDIHNSDTDDGEAPTFEVKDHEIEIHQISSVVTDHDLYRELGKKVLEIDWVKLGERFELEKNYDGGGWEHLGRAWRDKKAFGVFWYIHKRWNIKYSWLEFLDYRHESDQSIELMKVLEELLNKDIT